MWNFGSLAVLCLGLQIVTGVFLALHYSPDIELAFHSVEHIMRDVKGGWLVRYMHSNGASMFFLIVYIHIARGMFYTSYVWPRQLVWYLGVILFLLMVITAFLGYVLPWGQMSFWGATVITNLVAVIPVIGEDVLVWLWGGHSIDNATLTRFYTLHFTLPWIMVGLAGIHIILVQHYSSNNPLGVVFLKDYITFTPYYLVKDVWGFLLFGIFYSYWIFFAPNSLSHPDNYVEANPLVTPSHIVPEWYFLPFYAILRAIPDKLLGVIAMLCSILILFLLPHLSATDYRSMRFRPLSRPFLQLWWLFVILLALSCTVEFNSYFVNFMVLYYFYHPIVIQPKLDDIENFFLQIDISKEVKNNKRISRSDFMEQLKFNPIVARFS